MEDKITFAERLLKLLESLYVTLFKITKTRFGSGFIGFLIAFGLIYFVWIETLKDEILSHKNENLDLKKSLKTCETQKSLVYQEVRKELKAEQREYLEFTYNYMQKVQDNISKTNIQKTKEIEELENEIKKRKEVLK